jgi:hypothetical protein
MVTIVAIAVATAVVTAVVPVIAVATAVVTHSGNGSKRTEWILADAGSDMNRCINSSHYIQQRLRKEVDQTRLITNTTCTTDSTAIVQFPLSLLDPNSTNQDNLNNVEPKIGKFPRESFIRNLKF